MNNVYLDTTILINRAYGKKETQEEIKKKLQGKKVITSTFTIGEIKNNILQQCCNLYNSLLTTDNLFEAMLSCSENIWSTAWYNRLLKICTNIYDCKGDNSVEKFRNRLYLMIESFEEDIYGDIEVIRNEDSLICLRADAEATPNGDLWNIDVLSTCDCGDEPMCEIRSYLEQNRGTLIKIASSEKKELQKQIKHINNMLDGPKKHGRKCWYIGDSIISIEIPEGYAMYSSDTNHIKNICEILEKNMFE